MARPAFWFALTALATLAVACGDVTDSAVRPAPEPDAGHDADLDAGAACPRTAAELQAAILAPRCGASGCHGAVMPSDNLDLASPNLEARVVGAASLGCTGERIVVPGDPARSQLYDKVSSATPTCGDRMPIGAPRSPPRRCSRSSTRAAPPGATAARAPRAACLWSRARRTPPSSAPPRDAPTGARA